MSFLSIFKAALVFIFLASSVALFQNCQEPPQKTLNQNSLLDNPGQGIPGSSDLQIHVLASDTVATDCSDPSATYSYRIENASANLLACQAFTLQMPGFPRHLETYSCDDPSAFQSLANYPEDWTYDAEQRVWIHTTWLRNHAATVPGDYVLYVKEPSGDWSESSTLSVRKSGSRNCADDEEVLIPPPPPVGEEPVDQACGPVPNNVTQMAEVQWGRSTSSTLYALSGEIKAFPFTSSSDGRLEGRFETAYTSSNPRTRSTWISQCPGGAPLAQEFRGHMVCQNAAYEVTNIGWSEPGSSRVCSLKPNTRYYFNVRSSDAWDAPQANCGSSTNCGFYMRNTTY